MRRHGTRLRTKQLSSQRLRARTNINSIDGLSNAIMGHKPMRLLGLFVVHNHVVTLQVVASS